MSDISPIIQLNRLHFSLSNHAGRVEILQNIDLKIEKNATVAITGASGSGKTSLLMVMAGLEMPSQGEVIVCGRELAQMDENALAAFRASHIGIVFQSFHLIPTMTALENVALPLEFRGIADARAQAENRLTSLGLSSRLHHYPSQLSGGEQQRVAIARAVIANPSVLLADEPTGNLDHETGQQVMDLLFDLQKSSQASLLLITHDEKLAARCQRTIRLADGKLA